MITEIGTVSLKVAGALILILGIIMCLYYISKRFNFRSFATGNYPAIRLISTMSVAPKRSVSLIEVCDEWLLLGVGTDSVNLITKVKRPEGGDHAELTETGGMGKFQSILQGKLSGNKRKEAS